MVTNGIDLDRNTTSSHLCCSIFWKFKHICPYYIRHIKFHSESCVQIPSLNKQCARSPVRAEAVFVFGDFLCGRGFDTTTPHSIARLYSPAEFGKACSTSQDPMFLRLMSHVQWSCWDYCIKLASQRKAYKLFEGLTEWLSRRSGIALYRYCSCEMTHYHLNHVSAGPTSGFSSYGYTVSVADMEKCLHV